MTASVHVTEAYIRRARICDLLAAGYGVEDIAIRMSIDVSTPRLIVAELRKSGKLKPLLTGRSE